MAIYPCRSAAESQAVEALARAFIEYPMGQSVSEMTDEHLLGWVSLLALESAYVMTVRPQQALALELLSDSQYPSLRQARQEALRILSSGDLPERLARFGTEQQDEREVERNHLSLDTWMSHAQLLLNREPPALSLPTSVLIKLDAFVWNKFYVWLRHGRHPQLVLEALHQVLLGIGQLGAEVLNFRSPREGLLLSWTSQHEELALRCYFQLWAVQNSYLGANEVRRVVNIDPWPQKLVDFARKSDGAYRELMVRQMAEGILNWPEVDEASISRALKAFPLDINFYYKLVDKGRWAIAPEVAYFIMKAVFIQRPRGPIDGAARDDMLFSQAKTLVNGTKDLTSAGASFAALLPIFNYFAFNEHSMDTSVVFKMRYLSTYLLHNHRQKIEEAFAQTRFAAEVTRVLETLYVVPRTPVIPERPVKSDLPEPSGHPKCQELFD